MIRPAQTEDAPAIAALMNHWIENTTVTFNPVLKTAEEVATMIEIKAQTGYAFLVAYEEDRLVGQASYGQFRAGQGYATCMEHSISLLPGHSGKGTGRLLMQAIEDHARAKGAHQMIAGVSGENLAGRAFHERLGYDHQATIPEAGFKFGRFIDLILLVKRL